MAKHGVQTKVIGTLEDGREIVLPLPEEGQVPKLGIARKTRHIKNEEERKGEAFLLLLEHFLDDSEMEAWDDATDDVLAAAMEEAAAIEVGKG